MIHSREREIEEGTIVAARKVSNTEESKKVTKSTAGKNAKGAVKSDSKKNTKSAVDTAAKKEGTSAGLADGLKKPAVKKSSGLGRGLESLIPKRESVPSLEKNVAAAVKTSTVKEDRLKSSSANGEYVLNINLIEPNPDQPRKKFDEDKLNELAESIEKHGIIEPIVVQKIGERYQIIAGERRWRAARKAKLKEVPVVIKEYTERERFEVSLIENVQRDDLNAIEEAIAYQSLIDEFNMTHDEVADRVSKSRVAISNSIRLLKLDKRVQELVINDLISGGHARALLGLTDGDLQFDCAGRIIDEKLSVRETEKLVRAILNNKENSKKKKPLEDVGIYREYEDNLRMILGSKVQIQRKSGNKGKIVIEYNSTDEFEKLYDIIKR